MKYIHKGHIIDLYDSIQDLPVTRFQLYNLNLMLDAGIGSDVNGFVKRRMKVSELMKKDIELAEKELINLEMCIRFIMSKTSPEMHSFVALIKSIDGREITDSDLTEANIPEIIKELGKYSVSIRLIKSWMQMVKKKLDTEFETFFPAANDDSKVKEAYSNLLKRTKMILNSIVTGTERPTQEIERIDDSLLMAFKPKIYYGAQGMEVRMIKNFEDTCTMLELNGLTSNPKSLTTISFYQKVEALKQMINEKKRRNK